MKSLILPLLALSLFPFSLQAGGRSAEIVKSSDGEIEVIEKHEVEDAHAGEKSGAKSEEANGGEKKEAGKESEKEPEKEKKAGVKKTGKKVKGAEDAAMRVFGWKEWIWTVTPEHVFRAKLDTGARTCSIHASNVKAFGSDGEKWVQFTIFDPSDEGSPRLRHKVPVARMAKIKNDKGGLDERYVVPLTFQIGNEKLEAEFNLNDRSDMVCPILLGRNVLQNVGFVDSRRTYLLEKPKVKPAPPKKDKKDKKKTKKKTRK